MMFGSFARLKCSSHRLKIEAGKWHKPITTHFDESLCKIRNVVVNELQLFFECSLSMT